MARETLWCRNYQHTFQNSFNDFINGHLQFQKRTYKLRYISHLYLWSWIYVKKKYHMFKIEYGIKFWYSSDVWTPHIQTFRLGRCLMAPCMRLWCSYNGWVPKCCVSSTRITIDGAYFRNQLVERTLNILTQLIVFVQQFSQRLLHLVLRHLFVQTFRVRQKKHELAYVLGYFRLHLQTVSLQHDVQLLRQISLQYAVDQQRPNIACALRTIVFNIIFTIFGTNHFVIVHRDGFRWQNSGA